MGIGIALRGVGGHLAESQNVTSFNTTGHQHIWLHDQQA